MVYSLSSSLARHTLLTTQWARFHARILGLLWVPRMWLRKEMWALERHVPLSPLLCGGSDTDQKRARAGSFTVLPGQGTSYQHLRGILLQAFSFHVTALLSAQFNVPVILSYMIIIIIPVKGGSSWDWGNSKQSWSANFLDALICHYFSSVTTNVHTHTYTGTYILRYTHLDNPMSRVRNPPQAH